MLNYRVFTFKCVQRPLFRIAQNRLTPCSHQSPPSCSHSQLDLTCRPSTSPPPPPPVPSPSPHPPPPAPREPFALLPWRTRGVNYVLPTLLPYSLPLTFALFVLNWTVYFNCKSQTVEKSRLARRWTRWQGEPQTAAPSSLTWHPWTGQIPSSCSENQTAFT